MRVVNALAAERAGELACPRRNVAEEIAHVGEARTELGIADFHRHHRVLEFGELCVSFADGADGLVDESSDAG